MHLAIRLEGRRVQWGEYGLAHEANKDKGQEREVANDCDALTGRERERDTEAEKECRNGTTGWYIGRQSGVHIPPAVAAAQPVG